MTNRRTFIKTTLLGTLPLAVSGFSFAKGSSLHSPKAGYLLNEDFKTDPTLRGWKMFANEGASLPTWNNNNGHDISARSGYWLTPAFAVEPYKYYKVIYKAKGIKEGEINIQYLDNDNKPYITDTYDLMFLTENWEEHIFCFRAFGLAKKSCIQLISRNPEIFVDSISVEETDLEFVHKWREGILSTMPVIPGSSVGKSQFLATTAEKLQRGGRLRIVMLGDSTINDTGNSIYEASLQKAFPKVQFEVVNSVRGSTGCTWYQYENRVNEFVLRFNPDLLIIGGISNGYDVNAIRSVIQQVRKSQNPDIMILTDSITPEEILHKRFVENNPGVSKETGNELIRLYPEKLKTMAIEEKVDLLDMRTKWNTYTSSSSKPFEWFMRDEIHANLLGKQVVGQILLNYLIESFK